MAITLYTSSIVLKQLGENDYGIYNVVGGIVTMFSIVSASFSSAISRFLTFELGKENQEKLKKIFSTSVLIQICLWLIIAFLVESVGLWFLNSKMNISPERLPAANWVLQCSIITFGINMLSIPYNAVIIAHEKMQVFAYVSILEVVLKLTIALLLYLSFFDSLIMYAILLVVAALIVRMTYGIYCTRHFTECKTEFKYDKGIIKEMLGYSGWNFIGSSSAILRDQGVNIVMNLFCGTAVNAARGIAIQVSTAIYNFSQNFMLAVNPQIIKSYANGNMEYMFDLAFRSAKLSYFLLYCLSLPLILEMDLLLNLWLTIVPNYTTSFAILILVFSMLESISIPLQYMNQATGRIKAYQLTVGGIQMLTFPIAYLLLYLKLSPNSVYLLAICISQICLLARLLILRKSLHLSIRKFIRTVYLPIIYVSIIGAIIPGSIKFMEPPESIWLRLGVCLIGFLSAAITIFFIGCTKPEKLFITDKFSNILLKFKTTYA